MRKIIIILLISLFSFQLFATDSIFKLRSSLNDSNGLEKAKILYTLASRSDSLGTSERIDFCLQAEEIVLDIGDSKLLLDILLLESNLFEETADLENYSSSIEKYLKLNKEMAELEIEKNKKQIIEQERIRNLFKIGFIIFLNIVFVVVAHFRHKRTDKIIFEKYNKQLEELSRKDSLTSISNRRDILEKINHEAIRHERNKKAFSLVMGDLDHFKLVNDKHGHDCGDDLLIRIASTIVSSIRKQDIVGRWGGEEFLLLLPETNLEGGRITAEKVRRRIEQNDFIYNDNIVPITITFGVSEYSNNKGVELCIKEADTALYKGKSTGRNRVDVFQPKDILIG